MCDRDLLAIVAKYPEPGAVKTRLASSVGATAASDFARAMLLDLVAEHSGRDYDLVVATNPDRLQQCSALLDTAPVIPLAGQDLRGPDSILLKLFTSQLEHYQRVVALYADVPFAQHEVVTEAFTALSRSDVVVGPGVTGGYYLLGMKAPADLFSIHARGRHPYLGLTLTILEQELLSYRLLSPLHDLDTVADIEEAPWNQPHLSLPNTRAALRTMSMPSS